MLLSLVVLYARRTLYNFISVQSWYECSPCPANILIGILRWETSTSKLVSYCQPWIFDHIYQFSRLFYLLALSLQSCSFGGGGELECRNSKIKFSYLFRTSGERIWTCDGWARRITSSLVGCPLPAQPMAQLLPFRNNMFQVRYPSFHIYRITLLYIYSSLALPKSFLLSWGQKKNLLSFTTTKLKNNKTQ